MSFLEAFIIGLIQGFTEFLPVSSSGHLILLPTMFGLQPPDLPMAAITHAGTLLAILIYFRQDIWLIMQETVLALWHRAPFRSPNAQLGWMLVVGSIPVAIVGLLFEDFFNQIFEAPTFAAFFLLITAALIIFGEQNFNAHKQFSEITWRDTILIGLAQTIALFPGISRSGTTIVAGLFRGLDRSAAARFSFLLSLPAVAGASLLSIIDLIQASPADSDPSLLFVSFLTAAISGYACIHFLMNWLKEHSLYGFAFYCIALSLTFFIFFNN